MSNQNLEQLRSRIRELETEISEYRLKAEVSKKNEKLLKLYMEFTPAATAMCDINMRYMAYSRRWIIDYDLPRDRNLIGLCHYDVFQSIPLHWRDEHRRCFAGQVIRNEVEAFTRADGRVDWVRRSLYPWRTEEDEIGGLIIFSEVVTRQKEAEKEKERLHFKLQQAQKLESMGTLAGGIAHNFNNILMGIQGHVSLMLHNGSFSEQEYNNLTKIESYAEKASELTRDLLSFARGGQYEVRPTDLTELIREESKMFGSTRKEIKIFEEYEKDLWLVDVDRNQIQQALMNLYVNACQAMPDGGELRVSTKNVYLTDQSQTISDVSPVRYVKITVSDNGLGIDTSIQKNIFDPFFTTKPLRKGSGLGLASVYGIIKNHGGLITVESTPGEGATFRMLLPATDKAITECPKKNTATGIQSGEGTILLVDDEEMVIEVGEQMLALLGYTVITARDGEEALKEFGQKKGIDLVILDMTMPGMSGRAIFEKLLKIDPEVRVLISTGYSLSTKTEQILTHAKSGFLQKPYTLQVLSSAIHKLMQN